MPRRPWFARTIEEIYVYRTDKPNAALGLPFIGRHFAYVGRSKNGKRRHAQHMDGYTWNGEYHPPKWWADLRPRRYVPWFTRRKRRFEITTHFLEWFLIRLLLPVYNVSMNAGNPRRIKPWDQERQRLARNTRPAAVRNTLAVAQGALGGAVLAVVFAAVIRFV